MTINLKESIGLRVKTARLSNNLSQVQLAEKVGRTEETVSNIERAINAPNIETLERLSKALNVPMIEFFEGYDHASGNKKRMQLELEIRECLQELSVSELKIVKKQIQALTDKDD